MRTLDIPQRRKDDPLRMVRELQGDRRTKERLESFLTYDQQLRAIDPSLNVLDRGFLKRRHLPKVLERDRTHAKRRGDLLALYVADIDLFKLINDTYGHSFGDNVLATVAKALSLPLDHNYGDFVGRWGGEEFIVVKFGLSQEDFFRYGERLVEVVRNRPVHFPHEAPCHHDSLHDRVTVSVGGDIFPNSPADDLVAHADRALYAAKAQGRNRFVPYTPALEPVTLTQV